MPKCRRAMQTIPSVAAQPTLRNPIQTRMYEQKWRRVQRENEDLRARLAHYENTSTHTEMNAKRGIQTTAEQPNYMKSTIASDSRARQPPMEQQTAARETVAERGKLSVYEDGKLVATQHTMIIDWWVSCNQNHAS